MFKSQSKLKLRYLTEYLVLHYAKPNGTKGTDDKEIMEYSSSEIKRKLMDSQDWYKRQVSLINSLTNAG